jgi:hypothetical protein
MKYGDFARAFFTLAVLEPGFDLGHPSSSAIIVEGCCELRARIELCGGGTGVCFGANLPCASLVMTSGFLSRMAEVEALRLAKGLGGGIGVSFGANLPFESRSRERGAFSKVEEPTEARLLTGVLVGVPFGANLPWESLTTDEVIKLEVIDALRDFVLTELDVCDDAEDEFFGANLPLESRCTEIVFFPEDEAELVGLLLFVRVTRSRSRVLAANAIWLFIEAAELLVVFGVPAISSDSSSV